MHDYLKMLVDKFITNEKYVRQSNEQISFQGFFWEHLENGMAIFHEVHKILDFEIFNAQSQQLGRATMKVNLSQLTNWLITRSYHLGSEEVLKNLYTYINSESVIVYQAMPLHNLIILDEDVTVVEFNNGVKLIRAQFLPGEESIMDILTKTGSLHGERPAWVLLLPFTQPKHHFKGYDSMPKPVNIPEQKIEDVQRCLSLFCAFSLQPTFHATISDANSPIFHSGMTITMLPHRPSNKSRLNCDIAEVVSLVNKFNSLTEALKSKLRVAIDRLNNFNSNSSLVDRAIDLRIAMEALFKEKDDKEFIGFKVALHSSWYLGADFDSRMKIFKIFKSGYSKTSGGVHSGEIDHAKTVLFSELSVLINKSILKMIEDDVIVNWEEVRLGK